MSFKSIGLALALVFILGAAVPAASQEMPKKEAMAAAKTEAGPVKELACPPECGFAVRGRDVKEITAVMKKHAKTAHKMDVTDAQCKAMMKDAAAK